MKIVLISGMSGTGKTTICKNLINKYPEKFNYVNSYTDRDRRESKEWGHDFIDSITMDFILEHKNVVASTTIDKNRYCAIDEQFDKNKINLYVVDVEGINNVLDYFSRAEIMIILIRKNSIEADCIRRGRDVNIPAREDVDFVIDNNGTVDSSANLLNALVNFDLFRVPKHSVSTLQDKLDYIDMQYRFLDDMRSSLLEQMWYRDEPLYKRLCAYVQEKASEEMGFKVEIHPDTEPDVYDGFLNFHVISEYDEDLMWDDTNKLVEKTAYYAREFCEENECDDLNYHLTVAEKWKGEDEYV